MKLCSYNHYRRNLIFIVPKFTDNRQNLRENHVPRPRHNQLRGDLHFRRHTETTTAASVRTTGGLPEVAYWLPGDEATYLPEILLRVRSCTARDIGTSV